MPVNQSVVVELPVRGRTSPIACVANASSAMIVSPFAPITTTPSPATGGAAVVGVGIRLVVDVVDVVDAVVLVVFGVLVLVVVDVDVVAAVGSVVVVCAPAGLALSAIGTTSAAMANAAAAPEIMRRRRVPRERRERTDGAAQ